VGRVLRLPSTAGLKPFRHYFCAESIRHPAKANLWLLRYLIQHYTKPSDLILDPMAGTGSTMVMAALLGRDSIGVDIEEKFYEMMKKNAQKVRIRKPDAGRILVFKGDSRRLSKVLKGVGFKPTTIVTSPPYIYENLAKARHIGLDTKDGNIANLPHRSIDSIITSPPYGERRNYQDIERSKANIDKYFKEKRINPDLYAEHPDNINRLEYNPEQEKEHSDAIDNTKEYGEIDSIITSPPYSDIRKPGNIKIPITKAEYEELKNRKEDVYHDIRPERRQTLYEYYKMIHIERYGSDKNIDRIERYGSIDTILTSPPYSNSKKGNANPEKMAERCEEAFKKAGESWNSWGKTWKTPGRLRGLEALGSGYSEDKDNIGNLPHGSIDSIITSPPYSEGIGHSQGNLGRRTPEEIKRTKQYKAKVQLAQKHMLIKDSEENIGSLPHGSIDSIMGEMSGETYLEAMYKVYKECYKVLKPKGKMILILKRFVRKGRAIPLEEHTQRICEHVGFRLVDKLLFKLPTKSFWRILYERKHSDKCDVEDMVSVEYEVILVFEKPEENGNIGNLPYDWPRNSKISFKTSSLCSFV